MTLSEYRKTKSWQLAIELGPKLLNLAEELPGIEDTGLGLQLRQLMVDLPAAVAADLLTDTQTRKTVVLKLVAVLELIDHVYPALDTPATKTATDELAERLFGARFDAISGSDDAGTLSVAQSSNPASPVVKVPSIGAVDPSGHPIALKAAEEPAAPVAPADVQVVPDAIIAPAAEPEAPEAADEPEPLRTHSPLPSSPLPTETQEDHVLSDSVE